MELVLLFLFCFAFSAFFSGAEMAFVSSNQIKMREKAESDHKAAKKVVKFYQKSEHFLTTILIGNNIANTATTSIMTYVLSERFNIQNGFLVTLVMTPLLLIFAEMLPKDFARLYPNKFLLNFSSTLTLVLGFFSIFTNGTLKVVDFFLKPLGLNHDKAFFVSQTEFKSMVEESIKTGVVTKHEKKLIDTILDFEKIKVCSTMTLVDDVAKVDIHATVADVKAIAKKTKTRMLLVYEEIPSIIVGMVYVFDLLFEDNNAQGLRKFLRSPVFVTEETSHEKAFLTLQEKRQSYAVVIDKRKDVVGVVRIEKLLSH